MPFPRTRSILPTVAFLIFFAALGSSCSLTPPSFDEAAWRAKVQSADPALLYAPHFKDDRFFNPWMPERRQGVFHLAQVAAHCFAGVHGRGEDLSPPCTGECQRTDSRHAPGRFHYVGRTRHLSDPSQRGVLAHRPHVLRESCRGEAKDASRDHRRSSQRSGAEPQGDHHPQSL